MARGRIGHTAFALLVALTACGSSTSATPGPTLPEPPAVPNRWRTVTSDEGDVRLVVPPDVTVTGTSGLASGFRSVAEGPDDLVVIAVGPAQLAQPDLGESVADWLERDGWLTNHQEGDQVTELRSRELSLPAGAAIELTSEFGSDGLEYWSIVYAIRTDRGYALLQAVSAGPRPDEVPDEIRLMRELVAFGPGP
jgi:hypothetical protein